jgi:UDP-N-acetylglucosamine 2-epimerase (non-hydrolysing)
MSEPKDETCARWRAQRAKLVGSDPEKILAEASWLLDDAAEYERRSRIHNPYGDGHASERITTAVAEYLSVSGV